ncbi:hypothetical protein CU098_008273, partial [Rhizopus stolonifer]
TKAQLEKEAAVKAAARAEKLRQQQQAREEKERRLTEKKTQALFDLEKRIQSDLSEHLDEELPDAPDSSRDGTNENSGPKDRDSIMEEVVDRVSTHQVSDTKKMKITHDDTPKQTDSGASGDNPCPTSRHLLSSSRSFIRYLRSLEIDMLCLQETHAIDTTTQNEFNMLFNTKSSLWTTHCGIVSLHPHLQITAHSTPVHEEGRYICASVLSLVDPSTPLLSIINIYGPARSVQRRVFYRQLVNDQELMSHLKLCSLPTFILGDFNFDAS